MAKDKFSLASIIDKHIREKDNPRDNNFWHGSDMGFCPRKRTYKRQGVKGEEFDDRTMRVFECGNIFHEWLQKLLNKEGVLLSCEELLKDTTLNYSGHYDALIKIGDRMILYDFKTVNSMAFTYYLNNQFPPYHKMQLASYCYFLRRQFPELTEMRMLYISKDDLRVEEVEIPYTQELEDKVLKELEILNENWEKEELPPRIVKDYHDIYDENSWMCAKKVGKPRKDGSYLFKPFCPYFDRCWKKEPANNKIDVFIKK